MKKLLILFLLLFSFVASGQSLIFGGSTNAAARAKLKGNASNYTINAPTDSTFYLVSTTKYTEIPLFNISSRSLTFTGSNGIAVTGGTQNLGANRTWSTYIDSTSSPVITGLKIKGLGTGIIHANSVGILSSSQIVNADVSGTANIDATKLGTGVVSNTEFNYLDGLSSSISTQFDSKLNLTGGTLTGLLSVSTSNINTRRVAAYSDLTTLIGLGNFVGIVLVNSDSTNGDAPTLYLVYNSLSFWIPTQTN